MEKTLSELFYNFKSEASPHIDERIQEYISGGYVEFDHEGEWDIVRPGREDDVVLVMVDEGPLPIVKE